jgi:hypothetical protein
MKHRKLQYIAIAAGLASLAAEGIAQSQGKLVALAEPASCEKVVKDYLNTVRFVRQTSGAAIAGRIEQTYLNEADVVQMSTQQGYCGAANALKSKGVLR